ncbi:heat shock protein 9/12-domain-containing protein [Phaeosphaeria sp. MPI-PUGE-AT-0046c]|nr:heat shock protein 9/12-domain-containing protein [Phaeosphaeria sp. MPI-PUGE-AT-0046c]
MSEAFRKDFHTKAGEKMTPDSSKSTLDKTKESLTGGADKIARGAQPDSSKSHTQEAHDKFGRSKDEAVHGGSKEGFMDKTKHAFGLDKH